MRNTWLRSNATLATAINYHRLFGSVYHFLLVCTHYQRTDCNCDIHPLPLTCRVRSSSPWFRRWGEAPPPPCLAGTAPCWTASAGEEAVEVRTVMSNLGRLLRSTCMVYLPFHKQLTWHCFSAHGPCGWDLAVLLPLWCNRGKNGENVLCFHV